MLRTDSTVKPSTWILSIGTEKRRHREVEQSRRPYEALLFIAVPYKILFAHHVEIYDTS